MRLQGGNGWASYFVQIMPYMEQANIQQSWDLTLQYASQPVQAQQAQVKSFYCPARRSPMLSLAENFESADANPPPNFTYSGSVQARFGATEQSAWRLWRLRGLRRRLSRDCQ